MQMFTKTCIRMRDSIQPDRLKHTHASRVTGEKEDREVKKYMYIMWKEGDYSLQGRISQLQTALQKRNIEYVW